jgi:hypothetical protein
MRLPWLFGVALLVAGLLSACGAKTDIDDRPIERDSVEPRPETCDGVDNDLDAEVDEPWMDEIGRYVDVDHCGACDSPCVPDEPHEVSVECRLVDEVPLCVATECDPGYVPSRTGGCIPMIGVLCLPCFDDGDCGLAVGARCETLGDEGVCVVPCPEGAGCPEGYACRDRGCEPESGACWCEPGAAPTYVACAFDGGEEVGQCLGASRCHDGVLDECAPYAEVCDGLDNNCDGDIDEPYRDAYGAYVDIHNCGQCGVDCTLTPLPEGDLTCGGDPFLPHCVLLCEDTIDGIDPGDRVDADLLFGNGCECTVTVVDDVAGPVGAEGQALDVNCDGADGNVHESVYVAPDGSDDPLVPGSPNYPVQTLTRAIEIAEASLETETPRPHVFVAAGTYGEVLRVPEGTQVHGGYRRDFLALDPDAFQSVVYAGDASSSPGGAVVVIEDADAETVVEGLMLHGASAPDESGPAYGVVVSNSSSAVLLRDLVIYAGHGSSGRHGEDGPAGEGPTARAGDGELPRPAVEDESHTCIAGDSRNSVQGGDGGASSCGGVDVGGGRGGDTICPIFAQVQPTGPNGLGAGGGTGGRGGVDSHGPIEYGDSCFETVCCGLADFTVPMEMAYAGDGGNGDAGAPGAAGLGCSDALGSFAGTAWTGGAAGAGGTGTPGAGGGGGGAGGGAEMDWYRADCEFADGLGGGGGGGGGGGCGGDGGTAGTSGGPSIGVLVTYVTEEDRVDTPRLEDLTVFVGDGGSGARGGAGGDGGEGGEGGRGGELAGEDQTTPSLAGPTPGAHGGQGGAGGPGGGGGGGCGGSSIGVLVWLDGAYSERSGLEAEYRDACVVTTGRVGAAGDGGGGARAGGDGSDGLGEDVLVR